MLNQNTTIDLKDLRDIISTILQAHNPTMDSRIKLVKKPTTVKHPELVYAIDGKYTDANDTRFIWGDAEVAKAWITMHEQIERRYPMLRTVTVDSGVRADGPKFIKASDFDPERYAQIMGTDLGASRFFGNYRSCGSNKYWEQEAWCLMTDETPNRGVGLYITRRATNRFTVVVRSFSKPKGIHHALYGGGLTACVKWIKTHVEHK